MRYAKVERTIAGRVMSFETGRIAKQAGGSCLASCGETMILAAVCTAPAKPGIDFFPLTVEYREKTYAAGKFPGGFIKREGRPKDKEILTSRLIDRPIRPLWPEGYNDEVQLIATVVSADKENDPDIVAMNASFAATYLAPAPFQGPIAACRIGRVGGQFVAFPSVQQMDESDVDLVMAASRDALVMVEGQSQELKEEEFLAALDVGNAVIRQLLDVMEELKEKAGVPESTWQPPEVEIPREYHQAKDLYADRLREAVLVQGKHDRYAAIAEVKKQAMSELVPDDHEEKDEVTKWVKKALHELESEVMRALILDESKRIDLRGLKDIRKITIESGILPRTHGSALFTRGETQALVITTLGTPRDQQIVDGLMEEYAKRFDLQYNFPPFSVGEVRAVRGVGRREIGHGNLAERALASVIPSDDKFPYTIRLVSEITESNGSSSMASVCGGTIALMDSGVPIRQPVAGIAMGLIKEGDRVAILSDILGTEDHLGDMDFKVAGTGRGITAVQMDIKVKGLSRAILEKALRQAKEGRLHILKEMMKALPKPRTEISRHAPRLLSVQIPVEKIGMVIGPSGKTIKKIQEETGALVEIDDTGKAVISSVDAAAAQAAKAMVEQLTAEVEVGRIYQGRVVSIKDFGAFVEVLPGQEGLCHVSELDENHVRSVTDVVSVGDIVPVKVILRDEQGRLKLSRKAALSEGEGPSPDRAGRDAGAPPSEFKGRDRGGFDRGRPERPERPARERGGFERGDDRHGQDRGGHDRGGHDRGGHDRGGHDRKDRGFGDREGPRGGEFERGPRRERFGETHQEAPPSFERGRDREQRPPRREDGPGHDRFERPRRHEEGERFERPGDFRHQEENSHRETPARGGGDRGPRSERFDAPDRDGGRSRRPERDLERPRPERGWESPRTERTEERPSPRGGRPDAAASDVFGAGTEDFETSPRSRRPGREEVKDERELRKPREHGDVPVFETPKSAHRSEEIEVAEERPRSRRGERAVEVEPSAEERRTGRGRERTPKEAPARGGARFKNVEAAEEPEVRTPRSKRSAALSDGPAEEAAGRDERPARARRGARRPPRVRDE